MKKIVSRTLFSALFLGSLCLSAQADSVNYWVTVDTSSQSGNYGYIDLELNQGTFASLPVTASITDFSGGALNPADPNNDAIGASGSLPGLLTIVADTSTDYFEGLTFGNSISFDVTLSGAGVSLAGLAGGTSGTTFVFGFYDDSASNPIFTNDPSGATGLIDIANDGTVSADALPGPSGGASLATLTATPEPSTMSLFACAGLAFLLFRRKIAAASNR
jgi:hypothetical protein